MEEVTQYKGPKIAQRLFTDKNECNLQQLPPNSLHDVNLIASKPFTRSQARELQALQGLFSKMEVVEYISGPSKGFYIMLVELEGEARKEGTSPLSDGPSDDRHSDCQRDDGPSPRASISGLETSHGLKVTEELTRRQKAGGPSHEASVSG